MSSGLGTTIIGCIVGIAFIIAIFTMAYGYNQNLATEQKHGNYCMELEKNIMNDQQDPDLHNLTLQEINTYAQHCSS